MRLGRFVLAAALAIGIGGAASATPLTPQPEQVLDHPGVVAEYAKGGRHGWKGGRGHHYGWYKAPRRSYGHYRGPHRGWYRPHHRRVFYAPPRRHYGWYRGRHYGWRRHRPVYYAYPRRHYGWHHRPRGIYIRF
jgi:hypothetical protein